MNECWADGWAPCVRGQIPSPFVGAPRGRAAEGVAGRRTTGCCRAEDLTSYPGRETTTSPLCRPAAAVDGGYEGMQSRMPRGRTPYARDGPQDAAAAATVTGLHWLPRGRGVLDDQTSRLLHQSASSPSKRQGRAKMEQRARAPPPLRAYVQPCEAGGAMPLLDRMRCGGAAANPAKPGRPPGLVKARVVLVEKAFPAEQERHS